MNAPSSHEDDRPAYAEGISAFALFPRKRQVPRAIAARERRLGLRILVDRKL